MDAHVASAYEAVSRLRPSFLRVRAGSPHSGPIQVVVYVDGQELGGPQSLRQIAAGDVAEIRYLNAGDATLRFGTGNVGGAILVTTRR